MTNFGWSYPWDASSRCLWRSASALPSCAHALQRYGDLDGALLAARLIAERAHVDFTARLPIMSCLIEARLNVLMLVRCAPGIVLQGPSAFYRVERLVRPRSPQAGGEPSDADPCFVRISADRGHRANPSQAEIRAGADGYLHMENADLERSTIDRSVGWRWTWSSGRVRDIRVRRWPWRHWAICSSVGSVPIRPTPSGQVATGSCSVRVTPAICSTRCCT